MVASARLPGSSASRRGRVGCRRRCTTIQGGSHVAVLYSILAFAVLIQPAWFETAERAVSDGPLGWMASPAFMLFFWLVFGTTLVLYLFVCFADIRYHLDLRRQGNKEFEGRRCEECGPTITHARVKHCQSCGCCVEGFDHHCRYLNVCIGKRTYTPWFCFVFGLWLLMVSCCTGSLAVLRAWTVSREDVLATYALASTSSGAFVTLVSLQFLASGLLSVFLACLMGQHTYFVFEGMTTLEYIKDQKRGFPALPPYDWRGRVSAGDCYRCGDSLESVEVNDPDDIWYCSVCQSDIGRACIEFFSCESCEDVHICPVCRSIAKAPGVMVTTYRSSTLRRRAEAVQSIDYREFREVDRCISRQGSLGSHRETRRGRTSVVATVEGHTGDGLRKSICGGAGTEHEGYEASINSDEEGSSDEESGGDDTSRSRT